MTQPTTQVNYEALNRIAKDFHQESEEITRIQKQTSQKMDALRSNWVGKAADTFFVEMEDEVLPGTQRLANALLTAETAVNRIAKTFYDSDTETASYYNFDGESVETSGGSSTGSGTSTTSSSSSGNDGKTYIIPPFSFSFDFDVLGLDVDLSVNYSGMSAQDLGWVASGTATALDVFATAADTVSVVASGIGVLSDLATYTPLVIPAKVVSAAAAVSDSSLGAFSLAATMGADILQGESGWFYENDGTLGLAVGRDSIVSTRNFAVGTAGSTLRTVSPWGISTPFGIAGLYADVSQLDYDIEGWMGKEGGSIKFSSPTDGNAWKEVGYQMIDDWFILDLSPGLEPWGWGK